jgi:hypothetical protein
VKILIPFFLVSLLYSCSPEKSYMFTHYHVVTGFDPGSGNFSASVQMVYKAESPLTITFTPVPTPAGSYCTSKIPWIRAISCTFPSIIQEP